MKNAERRTSLIEAARTLFAERGFHGTTTKQVAAAAGVTESLIFRHFENKESLYHAVIDDYVERSRRPDWHDEIRACMAANSDADLIRALVAYVIGAYRGHPVMQRLVLFAILEGYHKEADRACHLPKALQKEVIAYFKRRQEEGALQPMNPAAVFHIIFGMARSYAIGKYCYKLKEVAISDDEATEAFSQFAIRAVMK
ncbi:TetR/AcrR family transcriptional regulator [Terriglobus roseus]|uniref:Transcriptional regulator, TetR family n=1 Tax=Terriglobus roseus TaxID=392734 RepID=A0A1H4JXC8_9BACT|nr:TetR/AcrR family transcriptional regulator [Terriglobus roseus]SEB50495.1 transcriptional regulator, TetR family [Terriglobus roseus]